MINYSINKNLNLPIKLFFNSVRRVRNYKQFVPWCIDSWETKGDFIMMKYEDVMQKFPSLYENKISREKLKEISYRQSESESDNLLKIKQYEAGIKVGFNILDFSYSCNIVSIEPNIVLSVTEGTNSQVFKKLESVWIMDQDVDSGSISVDYFINFEFKSFIFSNVTNLFLLFLGDNIMKAFITKCENEMRENKIQFDEISEDLNFSEILENKLNKINFDSVNDKEIIKIFLINMHKINKLNLDEMVVLMKILGNDQTFINKLVFLSELAIWNNQMQIEKIKNEILSF